jgi:hypothetical protein
MKTYYQRLLSLVRQTIQDFGSRRKEIQMSNGDNQEENVEEDDPEIDGEPQILPEDDISEVAKEVLAGQWGSGVDRRRRLAEAGHNPRLVEAEVVRLLNRR